MNLVSFADIQGNQYAVTGMTGCPVHGMASMAICKACSTVRCMAHPELKPADCCSLTEHPLAVRKVVEAPIKLPLAALIRPTFHPL